MAFNNRRRNRKQRNRRKNRRQRKSWSDRFVSNLIKNQFKSRAWRRVREFIDSFLPENIPFIRSSNDQGLINNNTNSSTTSSNNRDANYTSNEVINTQDQQVTTSNDNKIFGGKSKLLIHGFSLWYDLVSFLLSRERLVLDSDGHFTGGVKDYLAKVYREYGILACISNRQVMGPIAKLLVSTLYTVSIQMPIMDTLCENYAYSSPMVSQLVRRLDDILLMAVNYPIDTTCMIKFKRGDEAEVMRKSSLVQSLKYVKEQKGVVNGLYRGFGWSILENILYETSESLLSSGMNMLFGKLFGLECVSSGQVALSGDQLALFKKLQSTSIDLVQDVLLAPIRFSIMRYRTDMTNQYSSPIDCFKQVHAREGFRTFYKGTFIGTFLANKK